MDHSLAESFLRNRAELLPDDVWGEFVVPPFLARTAAFKDRKALKIEGGRGCGKTMLMKYLCHQSILSARRGRIPAQDLRFIGLYWKPDIRFCRLLTQEWLGNRADLAFSTYIAFMVLEQFAHFIRSMSVAPIEGGPIDLQQLPIPARLRPYFGGKCVVLGQVSDFINEQWPKLDLWVQNPSEQVPQFFGFVQVLEQLAEDVAVADSRLKDVFFRVFVDEYENLQPSQQRIVNDYVKQPGRRHCVNFAVRSHALSSFPTSTNEQLVEPHDFRLVNIEAQLGGPQGEFNLLAGEFLLLRLAQEAPEVVPVDLDLTALFSPSGLAMRSDRAYRDRVLGIARHILPAISAKEIAELALHDPAMRRRVLLSIEKALKKRHAGGNLGAEEFIREDNPSASIVASAVLHRAGHTPEQVLDELTSISAKNKEANLFTRDGGWIDNTLHGALFYLYKGLPGRDCLLYSGFDRFCTMAEPNLRFFQELCHQAFLYAEQTVGAPPEPRDLSVPPDLQARAAHDVSEKLVAEVEHCGLDGKALHRVVLRLGHLFEAAHRRPSQSEPEINHFSINDAVRGSVKSEASALVKQGLMWSVFYEEGDTKNKSDYDVMQADLLPNPIFAPYFGISYRKKRKLSLDAAEINAILCGSAEEYQRVLRKYSERWETSEEPNMTTSSLF